VVIDQRTSREQDPLSCLELRHSFGNRKILEGITLSLPPGAVFGLIGNNGAGKSTLIRILLGLIRPDSGKSRVFGCDSLELDDSVKQRLAYVPQQPEAFQWMKVGEMLDFIGGFYPAWDASYVDNMLARLAISRSDKLSKLSPGERQNVALIRALATQPALLILDEPAAALDPAARRELLREIAGRAGESGTTVFFSTHIVTDLERVASHVALLHGGRLMINAPMDDLKETHARLTLASEADIPPHFAGELSRRRHRDGSVSLVIERRPGEQWPVMGASAGSTLESLSLEDLFVEVSSELP
jgi:ABC-2 type transport system ATP-binding protein